MTSTTRVAKISQNNRILIWRYRPWRKKIHPADRFNVKNLPIAHRHAYQPVNLYFTAWKCATKAVKTVFIDFFFN